eukprot:scaffold142537_cov130-Phaeocystis_antarctica.AAC.1
MALGRLSAGGNAQLRRLNPLVGELWKDAAAALSTQPVQARRGGGPDPDPSFSPNRNVNPSPVPHQVQAGGGGAGPVGGVSSF